MRLLDAFRRSASIGQVLKTVDCSILFDATRPNPYERFNEDYDYFHSNVMCLTNLNSLLSSGGKLIVKKFVEHLSNKDRQNCLWLCGTQQEVNALLDTFPTHSSRRTAGWNRSPMTSLSWCSCSIACYAKSSATSTWR